MYYLMFNNQINSKNLTNKGAKKIESSNPIPVTIEANKNSISSLSFILK